MRKILYLCLCVSMLKEGESLDESDTLYVEYLEALDNNTKFINEYLKFGDLPVDDIRRHYVIFLGVLTSWMEYFNLCDPLEYDDFYLPVLDKMVPIYWQEPSRAVDKFKNISVSVTRMMIPIKENIVKRCEHLTTPTCNRILNIVAPEIKLEQAESVLLIARDLEEEFMKIETDLIKAVSDYNEISLLIKGQKHFWPLVERAAELYKTLMSNACFNDDVFQRTAKKLP